MTHLDDAAVRDLTGAWDSSTLPPTIVVGRGCHLERRESFARVRSTRQPGLVLGDDVIVYMWTAFSIEPEGRVDIGDGSVLVGAQLMCAERITVGRRVVLSHNVLVADCDFHPRDPELRRRDAVANAPGADRAARPPLRSQPVVIEDGAWVGIGAVILKGVRIGAGARVEAGAVVTSDVPAGARAAGNPARLVDVRTGRHAAAGAAPDAG